MVTVAILIVTCPCALSLATPAAMLASAGALAKKGVLVRRLRSLEALAGVDTVVFDKTGTLTRDALALASVRTRQGVASAQALRMAAALAQHSLHPASRALHAAWQRAHEDALAPVSDVQETVGQGVAGQWHGAGAQSGELRLGSASFCAVEAEPGQGLHACLSDAHGWLATFELHEDVRDDALRCVRALQADGVQVRLLSGDAHEAVQAVARQTGIALARGLCTPEDKLIELRQAQQQGRCVAVVGDGMNDAPVLAGALVSFAIGSAVPLARAQASFVILGDELAGVVQALRQARRTLRVVRQNLGWAAAYNALCVPLAVVGWLPAWAAGLGMATSSLLVVLNALRLSHGPLPLE
ncbi:MAG: HAD-IC family P-type ATPase, partial [Betaproteobacteria bacterium]